MSRSGHTKTNSRQTKATPKPPVSTVDSPVEPPVLDDQFDQLEQQLLEKDDIIEALTERLEQLAEQLDRLHRTGADRKRQAVGGFPAELVDQQRSLVEQLQAAVERWEDMQAAATLGRIEIQVSELRDVVIERLPEPGMLEALTLPASDNNHARPQETPRRSGDKPAVNSSKDDSSNEFASDYAAMKARLMGDPLPEPETSEPVAEISSEPFEWTPPAEVDLDNADREQLMAAIIERDEALVSLSQRLRAALAHPSTPPDWDSLVSVPAHLRAEVNALRNRLEEQLRLAEVEHSVERARLARDTARLKQWQHQLERDTNRNEAAGEAAEAGRGRSKGDRRWMKFLGNNDA